MINKPAISPIYSLVLFVISLGICFLATNLSKHDGLYSLLLCSAFSIVFEAVLLLCIALLSIDHDEYRNRIGLVIIFILSLMAIVINLLLMDSSFNPLNMIHMYITGSFIFVLAVLTAIKTILMHIFS